jgi:hypothetical protein
MSAHVSAAHAARMYGRSEKTVRRWIISGKLPAEKVDGAYLVDLADVAQLVGDVSAPMSAPTSAPSADTGVRTDEGDVRPSVPAQAEAMVSLIQTTIAAVLGPLVAEQAALRQTVERQAGELKEMARENGSLTAENAALNNALEARTAAQNAEALSALFPSRLRALAPWLLAALAIVVVVVLLAALR